MTLSGAKLFDSAVSYWFCLRTQPKREHFAAAALRGQAGLEVVSPRIRFRKATRRGPVWFVEAMFPGYLFARFVYATQFRQVQHVPGIRSLVGFGDAVGVLDERSIREIRAAAGEDETLVFAPDLRVGDSVKIAEGAFHGLEAVITQLLPAKERVKILLDFLGRQVEAEVALPAILSTQTPRSAFGHA